MATFVIAAWIRHAVTNKEIIGVLVNSLSLHSFSGKRIRWWAFVEHLSGRLVRPLRAQIKEATRNKNLLTCL